ncbi:putative disease resistance protein RGA4 isoform X2 [Papaver somniferum]|nr:putative disease resistance protein RGA4 isoform X2 [Papaver somniferum]
MDEFSYETMRRHEMGRQFKHKVRSFVSPSNPIAFRFKMARKIFGINEKLDKINEDNVRYTLNSSSSHDDQTRDRRNRFTSSIGDDSVLLGREGAKLDIVNLLTDKLSPVSSSLGSSSQQAKISTVSIVGMGGLGKTSLAQLVFNDESVEKFFDLKMWVCISNDFDVCKILRNILESITEAPSGDFSNSDVLSNQVKKRLIGKKYLLVLDDLWNEDNEDWEKLKNILVHGVIGSKMLVTTRNQMVTSVVGGIVYDLQKLSDDVSWSIIEKKVLSQGGEILTEKMIDIGKEIATKCDGLPLAAKSLGGVMSLKRDERYWLAIVNNNTLWDTPENRRVLSTLKLSYDSLPSHLKQCFSYCCLYPKGWKIYRETLIQLWVAEGLIFQPSDSGDSLEDVGNDYFEHLMWCSFFQEVQRDELGVIRTCKMHDFVHDLATSVIEPFEFAIVKESYGNQEFSEVRSFQMVCDEKTWKVLPEVLSNARKLRTVVALMTKECPHVNIFFCNKRLRVLCALGDRHTILSSSFPRFIHLRYLNITNCKIDSKHDMSFNHSYSLQTLVLSRCNNVPKLISEIGSLKKLRHINISYSDIKVLPDSIVSLSDLRTLDLDHCREFESLPEAIGSLRHLFYLFVSFTSITKLPDSVTSISSMGTLEFFGCDRLHALPRDLGELRHLRCLDLRGTSIEELPESCMSNLCNLEIVHLGAKCVLPKQIKDWQKLRIFTHRRERDEMPIGIEILTCLEKIESYLVREEGISDKNSGRRSGIEELASLESLKVLVIRNLENVKGKEDAATAKLEENQSLRHVSLIWGSSGVGEQKNRLLHDTEVLQGLQPHPSLKELVISGFSGLKLPRWMSSSSNCLLPNLMELRLEDFHSCEKLPSLGLLPCLTDLDIFKMHSVKYLGAEFYHDQYEGTTTTPSSLFPCLVRLAIRDMDNLEEWIAPPASSSSFASLEFLGIKNCKRLRSIPFASFSSLRKLNLAGTDDRMINLILAATRGGCLSRLIAIDIRNSPELTYFPLGILQTSHLDSLLIDGCDKLQAFRDDDLSNIRRNSLRSLFLLCCPGLMSLPDLESWTSLRELYIEKCDKLEESISYDLKKSLSFLDSLKVDYIQRKEQLEDPDFPSNLINLMEKK